MAAAAPVAESVGLAGSDAGRAAPLLRRRSAEEGVESPSEPYARDTVRADGESASYEAHCGNRLATPVGAACQAAGFILPASGAVVAGWLLANGTTGGGAGVITLIMLGLGVWAAPSIRKDCTTRQAVAAERGTENPLVPSFGGSLESPIQPAAAAAGRYDAERALPDRPDPLATAGGALGDAAGSAAMPVTRADRVATALREAADAKDSAPVAAPAPGDDDAKVSAPAPA